MEPTTTQTEDEPRRAARWEDLVDVFLSPAQLYRRRAEESWLTPFIILAVISIVLYYIFLPANTAVMAATQAQLPANAQATASKAMHTLQLLGGLFVPIGIGVSVVFSGALIWGFSKFAGAKLRFGQGILITVYAAYVGIVQQILAAVLIILKSNQGQAVSMVHDFSFGLMRFMPTGAVPPALVPLLGRLDVFAIWQAALWAVGIYVIAGTTKGRAIFAAAGAWLIFAIPGMIRAAIAPGSVVG